MSKRIAVFGAGLSGQGARNLALNLGYNVVVFDESGHGDRDVFIKKDLSHFDEFVWSPGFAAEHPWRGLAEASGIPCSSEILFAAKHWKGKIIGVTGTNGKTTLTALLAKALDRSGELSIAAGNIGRSFSDGVLSESNQANAYVVLEISSFQAELSLGIGLDALLWINFAEDHLDRYPSPDRYFEAKAKLFRCLKSNGICIVGPQVASRMSDTDMQSGHYKICPENHSLLTRLNRESKFNTFPYSENFSMAAEFWQLWGGRSEDLVAVANSFTLAPHRLNIIAKRGDVRFLDDSKATNFHATLAALRSVDRPIIWIGGGRSKGGDPEAFAGEISDRIEVAVLYGEVAKPMAAALRKNIKTVYIESEFKAAVKVAAEISKSISGANVLLSPGFSSLDQFKSYRERGKSFAEVVFSLKNVSDSFIRATLR